jgi:hypothetical protein
MEKNRPLPLRIPAFKNIKDKCNVQSEKKISANVR